MKKVILSCDGIYCDSLILVNIDNPCEENQNISLVPALINTPDILLECHAADALQKVMDKLCCKNHLIAVSGWRSKAEQEQIYNSSILENGVDFTQKYVAVPNHSEHQTGLAIDLGENLPPIDFIRPSFGYTGICADFRQVSVKFGFIERYPHGKRAITGIEHEPWHFRYVGVPHAEIIWENGFCLEEYLDFLKQNSSHDHPYLHEQDGCRFEVFYVKADTPSLTFFDAKDDDIFWASSDNRGGVIVTYGRNI